jgi:hypothetical protein
MTLEEFGLNAKLLIAGFAGGVVHAIVVKQTKPLAVIGSVLTGTLTANFLTPAAAHYVGGWLNESGAGFIVGLAAMAICQGMMALVSTRLRGVAARDQVKEPNP